MRHCPYTQPMCMLEPRFDITAPSDEAVASIVDGIQNEDEIPGILEAASGKVFRGQSCSRCGAWFPADDREEG
jgi:hypothetical protein